MSGSSYYYSLYIQKKNEVEGYEDNLKELNRIINNLLSNLNDEISSVNNEIDSLIYALNKGVRHNSTYNSRANSIYDTKEKAVVLDSHLKVSQEGLDDEIIRLKSLKEQAISERDNYYNQYLTARAEEKAAAERAAAEALAALIKK